MTTYDNAAPMDEWDGLRLALAKVRAEENQAVWNQVDAAIAKITAEARVIEAAQAFTRLSKTSVDPDSDVWFDHQRRLFDAVDAMDGAL